MAVPDLALICEIMLMAEGFQQSKLLSRKFIILYKLCEDLLSKVGWWRLPAWPGWVYCWPGRVLAALPWLPAMMHATGSAAHLRLPACVACPCCRRATTTGSCGPSRPRCMWLAA
jgi:hypothetical protein